jgi:hypothetical protein
MMLERSSCQRGLRKKRPLTSSGHLASRGSGINAGLPELKPLPHCDGKCRPFQFRAHLAAHDGVSPPLSPKSLARLFVNYRPHRVLSGEDVGRRDAQRGKGPGRTR